MSESIYQKILGKEFDLLGPNLQLAHRTMGTVKANGKIDVKWGKGFMIKLANKISGLPPAGDQQDLELEVLRDSTTETWNRKFKNDIFTTVQFQKKGLLVEKDGPIKMIFKLKVENSDLVYEQVKMKFFGVTIPKLLSMKSSARATEQDKGWCVTVNVKAPMVGNILTYCANVNIDQ
jgi:hypothetical protein